MSTVQLDGAQALVSLHTVSQSSNWVSAKTQKFALGFFATLAVATGIAAIVFSASLALTPFFIALITGTAFTLGGGLAWEITRVKDYDNPTELASYRQQAAMKHLEFSIQEHGWDNMFKYGIPMPEVFPERYRYSFHQRGTVNFALEKYVEVQRAYQSYRDNGGTISYVIPHPRELCEKWNQEIMFSGELMLGTQIVSTYNIEQLASYEILPLGSRRLQALRDCQREFSLAKQGKATRLRAIDSMLNEQCEPHRQALECARKAVAIAQDAEADRDWEAFKRRTEHHVDLNRNPNDPIARARVSRDYWEQHFARGRTQGSAVLAEAQAVYDRNVKTFKEAAEQQRKQVETDFQERVVQINDTFRRNA